MFVVYFEENSRRKSISYLDLSVEGEEKRGKKE
jgi:hypothetical protein